MRDHLLLLALLFVAAPVHADIFKCIDARGDALFTASAEEAAAKNCERITATPTRKVYTQRQIEDFRRALKPGSSTWQGMVIELKPPLAHIQSRQGQQRWHRIDELEP